MGAGKMLEDNFARIYTKFKMSLYSKVFNQKISEEGMLTSMEVLCVEVIYALERPTINEFASFTGMSAPNAAYRIGHLIKKGHVNKIQSKEDKREYYLEVTDKYMETYGVTYDYIATVMQRIRDRFSPEEVEDLENVLEVIDKELMPEVKIKDEKN